MGGGLLMERPAEVGGEAMTPTGGRTRIAPGMTPLFFRFEGGITFGGSFIGTGCFSRAL